MANPNSSTTCKLGTASALLGYGYGTGAVRVSGKYEVGTGRKVYGLQMVAVTVDRRQVLSRRIRLFVAATISYNVIEAAVALTEGARVSSTALIGFGLDSVIEVSSATAVAWQFAGRDPEAREKIALRIIAFSFFGLAVYVTVDAGHSLLGFGEARHSIIGITLAAVSLVVMPVLSYGQRRAGRELGSRSAVADSKQTLLCTYLSALLLIGLLLNSLLGWSWADPMAGLVIAGIAVKEGIDAWKGGTCCPPTTDPKSAACCESCDTGSMKVVDRDG
jgi:Co/Zn/Cd efflux system component